MSDDNKSGSDLDIFEGLGKKSAGRVSAAPPPPPVSANVAAAPPAPPPNSVPSQRAEMKRTLVGIPGPAQPPSQGTLPSTPSVPPPPPVSQGRVSSPPPLPSQSGSMRAASPSTAPPSPSKPPPPPGRASLPNLSSGTPSTSGPSTIPSAQTLPSMASPFNGSNGSNGASSSQRISQVPPPPPSARLSSPPATTSGSVASAVPTAPATNPSPAPTGGKLDMDWDDDNEATHVFDKDNKDDVEAYGGPESRNPEHASMDDILSSPRPQPPAAGTPPPQVQMQSSTATLSGAFGALGQPRESNGAAQFKSGAPPSQSLRSAPPPPPASMRQPNPSTTTAPIPPPPPPGQTTTMPMHMPMSQPPGMNGPMNGPSSVAPMIPQQSLAPQPSIHDPRPPYSAPPVSQAPMPHMPPISRAMEATAVVPRNQSKAGLIVALLVGVVIAVGVGVFFLMPRTGTIVVNVADAKGGAVSNLAVEIDGKQACSSAPCIVRDVASGVHQVKVSATGFDPPAPKAVTVEGRKDSTLEFSLSGSGAAASGAGTGLKASGSQTGVRLVVDGKEYGPLPQEIHDLAAGDHKVRFVGSDRYQPLDKTVVVKQDEVQDLGNIQLKVLKGKATIQLGTPGAKVFLVNGATRKEVPQFPIAIDFDPNEHWQLEAKMVGMDDFASPISFDDGQAEKTITVTLSPKGTSPAAPVTAAPPRPAQPAIAWTPPAPKQTSDAPAPAPAAPKPDTSGGGEAFLNINSKPASTVLLDGKPLGATPRVHVSVTPGTHTVLFVNAEESLKKSVSVTVKAGETSAVIGKLRD